jgi:hypothetical protein
LGESEQVVQTGEWYKVRITPPDSSETRSNNEAAQNREQAQMLMPVEFELDYNDRVEIDSKEMGLHGIWIVVDQPTYIRKKRVVIGKSVNIVRTANV